MKIIIENLQDKHEVTGEIEELLNNSIRYSLEEAGFDIPCEVSVLLVDNEKMREINLEYRKNNRPTDVLSFPMVEVRNGRLEPEKADYDMETKLLLLGDIVISLETAWKQAGDYNHSVQRELAFLATHGVFHLLGYDHEPEDNEKIMLKKQEKVLERMGLRRQE